MNFYVGQKVVCIGFPRRDFKEWLFGLFHPSKYPEPVKGKVYTVANQYISWTGNLCLELFEIDAPEEEHWCAGFLAVGFRPAIERKTDIGVLTALLNKSPTRIKEPALALDMRNE